MTVLVWSQQGLTSGEQETNTHCWAHTHAHSMVPSLQQPSCHGGSTQADVTSSTGLSSTVPWSNWHSDWRLVTHPRSNFPTALHLCCYGHWGDIVLAEPKKSKWFWKYSTHKTLRAHSLFCSWVSVIPEWSNNALGSVYRTPSPVLRHVEKLN